MKYIILLFVITNVFGGYKRGDAIPSQYQIRTNDVVYKWEPMPYSTRPKFGESTKFTMSDLGVSYFFNDELKIRFSFQNGRYLTSYIPIHTKGKVESSNTIITFDTSNFNVTGVKIKPTKYNNFVNSEEKLTPETFGLISFEVKYKQKINKYLLTSQNVILSVALVCFTFISVITLYKNLPKKK